MQNSVHILIQSVPNLSVSKICMIVKNITVKEIFKRSPEVKAKLFGWDFGQVVITQTQ